MIENEAANELDRRRIRRKSPRIQNWGCDLFFSAEFERSSQTNLRDCVQRTMVSNLIPLTPGQASDTIAAEYVFGCREGGLMQSKKKKEQSGLTALYCRLSRDDGAEGDSNSVANQKRLLQKYAKENSLGNTRFYVDEAVIIGLKTLRLKKY